LYARNLTSKVPVHIFLLENIVNYVFEDLRKPKAPNSPRATRLGSSSLWSQVSCTALGGSGTFVGQSEERGDSFHVMCGQLFQHFFIMYSLSEGRDDRSIRNMRYRTSYLGEAGDELLEGFPGLLPHYMEVGLHTVLLVSTGEVHHETRTEFFPGVD
jgi:hypothetical protein